MKKTFLLFVLLLAVTFSGFSKDKDPNELGLKFEDQSCKPTFSIHSPKNSATITGSTITITGFITNGSCVQAINVKETTGGINNWLTKHETKTGRYTLKFDTSKLKGTGRRTFEVYIKKTDNKFAQRKNLTLTIRPAATTTGNNTTTTGGNNNTTTTGGNNNTATTGGNNNTTTTGGNNNTATTGGNNNTTTTGGNNNTTTTGGNNNTATTGGTTNSGGGRRVGDPGVSFGAIDSKYAQGMGEWRKAGVEGGIPLRSSSRVAQTISATNTAGIQRAISAASSGSNGVVQVVLNNGTYDINSELKLASNVRLVGQSQEGVILNISMTGSTGSAITFSGVSMSGIENLTVQGGQGVPNDFTMTNAKSSFSVTSIFAGGESKNCWIDGVKIINSGNHGIDLFGTSHFTIRDCYIERSWNKGEGGKGYVQINASHTLIFNNTIKKMRHFALQKEHCKFNVVYRNTLEQDINFHDGDAGFNLAEKNVIVLPEGLPSEWHAVMGKWSEQHSNPGPNNVVYGNQGTENNNGGITSFCDTGKVWVPKGDERDEGGAFTTNTDVPSTGSFYNVTNVANDGAQPSEDCTSPDAAGGSCAEDSGPGNIFNDDFNCENWQSNYVVTDADDPAVNGNDVTFMTEGGFDNSSCLRVKISTGSHYGCDFRYKLDIPEAFAQYKVLYEPGFPGSGVGMEGSGGYWGKSPGWDGTRRSCGWGNCVPTASKPGWSARGSLDRVNGKIKNKVYTYYMDMTEGQDFGDSWYYDAPAMDTNKWYTIDQHIKVNTPGQKNGELRVWQDGKLVFQQTGINFTETGGEFATIEGFWFNYYYGGKPVADQDTFVRLDEFRVGSEPFAARPSGDQCVGSQCAVATLTSPKEGANLKFPFKVSGSVNTSGYRMSVVMSNSSDAEDAKAVWVGGTTGSKNSGSFTCESKPMVKTGATKLTFYGVDDDGNGDGFAYFTEEIIIDVNLSGSGKNSGDDSPEVKAYPNPASNNLNLELGSDHNYNTLQIIDLAGNVLINKSLRSTDFKVNIDLDKVSIAAGIYMLRVLSEDGSTKTVKFVKE